MKNKQIFREQRWKSLWRRISCIPAKDKENLYDTQTNTTFSTFKSFRQYQGGKLSSKQKWVGKRR